MGYKLKQWIIKDVRTGEVEKVRAKSRQSLGKRLGQMDYVVIVGTVKSLTKGRRAREELEECFSRQGAREYLERLGKQRAREEVEEYPSKQTIFLE